MGDVHLTPLDSGRYLAVACDSAGGIGNLEHDKVKVDPEITGYYTAWVALFELMALRAEVVSVSDTLSVPWEPTGRQVVKGITELLDALGVSRDVLTGSTEENIAVTSTGIGVTAVGILDRESMRKSEVKSGDKVAVIGYPKMGDRFVQEEVIGHKGEVMTPAHLKALLESDAVGAIRPAGSKGIGHELDEMVDLWRNQDLEYIREEGETDGNIDFSVSSGPGTCCICTINGALDLNNMPITHIGKLKLSTGR